MRRNEGFSLVEVLITLILTSLGILGMFVLQSNGVKYTQEITNRNNAIFALEDLTGIIRAYRDEVFFITPPKNGSLDSDGSFGDYYLRLKPSSVFYRTDGALAFTESDCPTTGVPQTAEERAGCWLKEQVGALPGLSSEKILSEVKICPSNAPGVCATNYVGSTLEVVIAWEGSECDSSICKYSVSLEL